jgi:hypothetical protein
LLPLLLLKAVKPARGSFQTQIFSLQIFVDKESVEQAVRNFIQSGYYLGFIKVEKDESFSFNPSIKHHFEASSGEITDEDQNQIERPCTSQQAETRPTTLKRGTSKSPGTPSKQLKTSIKPCQRPDPRKSINTPRYDCPIFTQIFDN